jgi:hypothetical protein
LKAKSFKIRLVLWYARRSCQLGRCGHNYEKTDCLAKTIGNNISMLYKVRDETGASLHAEKAANLI